MKSKSKMKNAISLIILVVTILVLSILAAAVIISLSNSNIMTQASNTVFKSDMANFKEAYEMYVIGKFADDSSFDRNTLNVTYENNKEIFEDIFGENVSDKYKKGLQVVAGKLVYETEDDAEKDILEDLDMAEVVLVTYTDEGIPIPADFYYVGGDKATGLVISDDIADKNRGVGENDICVGNQFVWIPIEDTSELEYLEENESEGDVKGRKICSQCEPHDSNAWEVEEYNNMIASIQKYGGFYIARFEAGDADATASGKERTTVTEAHTVVSKANQVVYNYVPWGGSEYSLEPSDGLYRVFDDDDSNCSDTETTEKIAGAAYLSQNMYKNHKSVVSTLCYGYQWDAAWDYIETYAENITETVSDSTEEDSTILQRTGYSEDRKMQNIYDLKGNVSEWSMLYSTGLTTGEVACDITANGRNWYDGPRKKGLRSGTWVRAAKSTVGFRVALYIKL